MVKRNHTIGNMKSKYWDRTHKFGVKITKLVQEEIHLRKKTTIPFDRIPYANK